MIQRNRDQSACADARGAAGLVRDNAFLVSGVLVLMTALASATGAAHSTTVVESPDGRNSIKLSVEGGHVRYSVNRDGRAVIAASRLGPEFASDKSLHGGTQIVNVQHSEVDEQFQLLWGKTSTIVDRCSYAIVTLANTSHTKWQIELRAYDDGVAFRYRLLGQKEIQHLSIQDELTQFNVVDEPLAMFITLDSFTTSHESLYERQPLKAASTGKLLDCPLLLDWPGGPAAAITEARVRHFAGMYLERESQQSTRLRCRLSPHPAHEGVAVVPATESPWRVVLLADIAGKLLESNLLLCLNDPPEGDFSWATPGKTTFHWWNGDFEDDHKLSSERDTFVARHRKYIDFCTQNDIAYHTVSGDGRAWYQQSDTDYGTPAPDADVRVPRAELGLPEILAYARQRGVGIRLWVHWQPLSRHLDEAMAIYESWGVKGLMVDFLNRDDQEMVDFTERMLKSAAAHKIHIQIHGCSKYSGEQRTFPHLFNREGVLNLEYSKWSKLCTPAHNVNVAFTRALAGPVDYHLGGFRSAARDEFTPRDRQPLVMGTRCHNLALYVVYENPMPMVADTPDAYVGQVGFDFIRQVPTTWDETRFLAGELGEFCCVGRRRGHTWYLGGINNWTPREFSLPLDFLALGEWEADVLVDALDDTKPNDVHKQIQKVDNVTPLQVSMATGGGFVAVVRPATDSGNR